MNSDKFNAAISAGKPYFGEEVLGTHGKPERQRHMTDLVRFVCSERNHQPIKILEIGSWIGASAITWSNAIRLFNDRSGQVFCVDPWEPYLFNQETPSGWDLHMDNLLTNDFAYQVFDHNIQCSGNNSLIQAFRGLSSSIVPNFPDDTFDIIFIDGAHDYESVKQDIQIAKPKLVNFGVLCGDDYELQLGEVDKSEIIEHIEIRKDYCLDSKTGLYFHLGVTLAVSEEFEIVGSRDAFWFVQSCHNGWDVIDYPSKASIPTHIVEANPYIND